MNMLYLFLPAVTFLAADGAMMNAEEGEHALPLLAEAAGFQVPLRTRTANSVLRPQRSLLAFRGFPKCNHCIAQMVQEHKKTWSHQSLQIHASCSRRDGRQVPGGARAGPRHRPAPRTQTPQMLFGGGDGKEGDADFMSKVQPAAHSVLVGSKAGETGCRTVQVTNECSPDLL